MDLINLFVDLVIQPLLFISLLLFLPPFYLFKLVNSFLSSCFPENLAGKVVLITGASSGIGEHLAYEYAKRGAVLVLVARRNKSLQDVAQRARDFGSPSVLVMPANVTNPDECRNFVETTVETFGRLDHLVNDAGVLSLQLVEEVVDPTNLRPNMDVNFWGSVYSTYFAIPYLKRSRGRIIGVTSFSAYTNFIRMSFYNASKGAVASFYHTLRTELGNEIAITEIVPGLIESELTKGKIFTEEGRVVIDQELRDAALGPVPIERTEEFAKQVIKSICRGARYVLEPPWYSGVFYFRVLIPDISEWVIRVLYRTPPGVPATENLVKKLVDLPFVKNVLYPSCLRSPEIKLE